MEQQQAMSGPERYRLFRTRYPEFIYDRYDIEETTEELSVTYHFQIPGLAEFAPVWRFPKALSGDPGEAAETDAGRAGAAEADAVRAGAAETDEGRTGAASDPLLRDMLFSLGMVELVSYWKTACPPRVVVRAGHLDEAQIRWWKDLYRNGLGEFFYVNQIREADDPSFMEIVAQGGDSRPPHSQAGAPLPPAAGTAVVTPPPGLGVPIPPSPGSEAPIPPPLTTGTSVPFPPGPGTPVLVPIGGGKDSVVTLELLKEGEAQLWGYIINPRGATLHTAETAQIPPRRLIKASRTLDANMLELNRQGFLNGHTPFSAIVAFSSLIAARLHGLPYIALSNESSANESTVQGCTVNHQYSKSFRFEKDFHAYTTAYLPGSSYYFSMLRPLSEFQIAAYFARLKDYHRIFRSCNVGSKKDVWCGHCPKCLFVYLILSPFLEQDEVAAIFGKDLLEDETLQETLAQLVGIRAEKPFECVGSRDEVNTALLLTIRRIEAAKRPLPKLLQWYKTTELYGRYLAIGDRYHTFFDRENLVPGPWETLVRTRCLWR